MSNVTIDNFNEAGGKLAGFRRGWNYMKAGRDEVRRSDQRREAEYTSWKVTMAIFHGRRDASQASQICLDDSPIVWAAKRTGDRLESLGLIRRGICIRFATLASIQLAAIKTNDCATYPSAPPCISPRALYSSDKRQPGRCRK